MYVYNMSGRIVMNIAETKTGDRIFNTPRPLMLNYIKSNLPTPEIFLRFIKHKIRSNSSLE